LLVILTVSPALRSDTAEGSRVVTVVADDVVKVSCVPFELVTVMVPAPTAVTVPIVGAAPEPVPPGAPEPVPLGGPEPVPLGGPELLPLGGPEPLGGEPLGGEPVGPPVEVIAVVPVSTIDVAVLVVPEDITTTWSLTWMLLREPATAFSTVVVALVSTDLLEPLAVVTERVDPSIARMVPFKWSVELPAPPGRPPNVDDPAGACAAADEVLTVWWVEPDSSAPVPASKPPPRATATAPPTIQLRPNPLWRTALGRV
jgi:hypothetical protein